MDALRFDRISKRLAQRRQARHSLAQEATPAAELPGTAPELLFVQSFQAGAITPKEGTEGRYTLSLEGGHGQTIYFSDRPDRVVGAAPIQQVLDRLGFPADNPPNAALVVETAAGQTDVAVVELFSPVYDEATGGITYEVAVLENWEGELGVGLQEAPADLATLEPSFGTAHLFIDGVLDCLSGNIRCRTFDGDIGEIGNWEFDGHCSTYPRSAGRYVDNHYCLPCSSYPENASELMPDELLGLSFDHWQGECNARFSRCDDKCWPFIWCIPNSLWAHCPNFDDVGGRAPGKLA